MMHCQITPEQRKILEKQQYRFVGNHSAVKVCGWTKNSISNKGECYKEKFYGIRCHQCLQMTTSMYCANRCKICWRSEKAPVSKKWYGPIDEPNFIIDNSIKSHVKLLQGFKGRDNSNKTRLNEMDEVKHVALSLIGEPITYPKINQILSDFHKRNISTFLVTNAQFPEDIKKIKYVTQLYISLDAPNKQELKELDRPLFKDYYERLQKSLRLLSKKKFRTCIRLTIVKGINDTDLGGYAELIEKANPDFIEVKSYMHVGESRNHLERSNMMPFGEIQSIARKLAKMLNYEYLDDHQPSVVACLMNKSMKGKRYIDFKKFFDIANNNKKLTKTAYSSTKLMSN
jgi:tRNA wybutosine-synthesizing protein 1